jgi:predicted site-specific integrase-resolvase
MPVAICGQTYFRTAEVCQSVGISKSTLFRCFKQGTLNEAARRDRNGWRLFTEYEVNRIKEEVYQINFARSTGPAK